MRGKYLICGLFTYLLLAISLVAGGGEQLQKVSPANAGFTIQPFVNGDSSGPPTLDHSSGAALDPTIPVKRVPIDGPLKTVPIDGPPAIAPVPEPSTIAMLVLGSCCAGAFTALRRRRRD